MPHVRPITGTELWELRIRGRTQHRVLYLAVAGRRLLLLHAFQKKTEHTPERAIATAQQRLADYRRRHGQ
jgi:phage-related protein